MMRANAFKKFVGAAAVAVVFGAGVFMTGCGGGGKSFNSASELLEYLNSQPANSPDKPIKVAMKVNENMVRDVSETILEAGKYVSLDLTGSPLTEIPDYAFIRGCKNLAGITMPNSVTSIGEKAFEKCENLVNVTIPNGVATIGKSAFSSTGLTNITIPNSVTSIADFAFSWCQEIKEITIPRTVEEIGFGVFSGWTDEQTVNVPFANEAAADAAWGDRWRRGIEARINYVG